MRETLLSLLIHFLRGERALAVGDHVQDHLSGPREASAAAGELVLPSLADFGLVFLIHLIENRFQ